jgi:hypothetical protein
VINATINNISVTSWQSVLLVEETEVSGGKPPNFAATSHLNLAKALFLYENVKAILQ